MLKIVSEQVLFVSITIFSSGVHFLFSIFVKAHVNPYEYGIYSSCLILQTYLAYLQLGCLNAFNRDYPQLVGAKKNKEAEAYRNTVFTFLLLSFVIVSVFLSALLLLMGKKREFDERYTYGLVLCTMLTAITIIENFGNYRVRIDRGFTYISIVMLLELLPIIGGIWLVPIIGYYAIYITSLCSVSLGIVLYLRKAYQDIKFEIDGRLLKEIIKSGMPLLINGLIWTVVNSIDKFVILGFISTEALGIYGVAQNAFTYMVLIPSAISQLFYVAMGKEYGKTKSVRALTQVSVKFTVILAVVTSFLALLAYYCLPMLVEWVMPNYLGGVPSAQILILGLSIYAATLINGNILTILKQNRVILRVSVYMCVFNLLCSVAFISILGRKIECVALGTAISYMINSIIVIYQVQKYTECNWRELFKVSVIPVCFTLLPGYMIYYLPINKLMGLAGSILSSIIFYLMFFKEYFLAEFRSKHE